MHFLNLVCVCVFFNLLCCLHISTIFFIVLIGYHHWCHSVWIIGIDDRLCTRLFRFLKVKMHFLRAKLNVRHLVIFQNMHFQKSYVLKCIELSQNGLMNLRSFCKCPKWKINPNFQNALFKSKNISKKYSLKMWLTNYNI